MGMLFRYHNNNIDIKAEDKGVTKAVAPKSDVKEKENKPEASIVDEIKAMSGAKLRKFAKENGVEDPEELTVGEIKAILIEKLS